MDKQFAIHNLEEAKEHLDGIIDELKKSKNLEPLLNGYLNASFREVYWHINKIWNGRIMSQSDIDKSYDAAFDRLCNFPSDLEL